MNSRCSYCEKGEVSEFTTLPEYDEEPMYVCFKCGKVSDHYTGGG